METDVGRGSLSTQIQHLNGTRRRARRFNPNAIIDAGQRGCGRGFLPRFSAKCRGTAVPVQAGNSTVPTVPAMIWPRILVFTSMMLRVLTPAAFGSYGAGIYIPKLGLVPKHVRPVRPVANLYDLLAS